MANNRGTTTEYPFPNFSNAGVNLPSRNPTDWKVEAKPWAKWRPKNKNAKLYTPTLIGV